MQGFNPASIKLVCKFFLLFRKIWICFYFIYLLHVAVAVGTNK